MTINLTKLNNGDTLIVETENLNNCYEIKVICNETFKVSVYERVKYPKAFEAFLSSNLDSVDGIIEKGRCIVFTDTETKITDLVKGVTLVSIKGFELDIYPDKERNEKLKMNLEEAKARIKK